MLMEGGFTRGHYPKYDHLLHFSLHFSSNFFSFFSSPLFSISHLYLLIEKTIEDTRVKLFNSIEACKYIQRVLNDLCHYSKQCRDLVEGILPPLFPLFHILYRYSTTH